MRKFVLLFLLFFNFTSTIEAKESCKRPRWQVVYDKDLKCKMFYNHYILYKTSEKDPVIEVKNGFCKVIGGVWRVKSFSGEVAIYTASDLNIDHILPYNYIVKQVGCEKAKKYFNVRYNLEPLEASYNKSKSDKVCYKKEECEKQKIICHTLEEEFGEKLNCDKL